MGLVGLRMGWRGGLLGREGWLGMMVGVGLVGGLGRGGGVGWWVEGMMERGAGGRGGTG